ncbi:hypothetical protein DUZ99_02675 [Xylanibacillus composti]|nr:hypothetical protein [Xylanibacillus composti]MDT9723901.1 hypothetical protein [Xylanibacillus composti]
MNLYTYVYNNPLLYTDPSGHKPYINLSSEDKGIYSIFFTDKFVDHGHDTFGVIPWVGSWINSGMDSLANIEPINSNLFTKATDILTNSGMDLYQYTVNYEVPNEYYGKRVLKFSGKFVWWLSAGLNAKNFLDTYNYDTTVDEIIDGYNISGNFFAKDYMASSSKEQLLAKYLHAELRIKEFLADGKITESKNAGKYGTKYIWDGDALEQLREELLLIE